MFSKAYPLLVIALVGCGSDSSDTAAAKAPCASSPVLGSWTAMLTNGPDTMTFKDDCTGTSSRCQATFQYPAALTTSGNVLIKTTSTNGAAGCGPVGEGTCQYMVSATELGLSCGAGVATYKKNG